MRILLGILTVWSTALWAELPLAFIQVPDLNAVALGQVSTLNYVIKNNVKTQGLPIKSISIINDGDSASNASISYTTNCPSVLPSLQTCSITVSIDNPKTALNRHLSINYGGRAPLNSTIQLQLANYTLLIYMVGSDLESGSQFATKNIQQMMRIGSTKNMNVVLETGGADSPGWETVQRKIVFRNRVELLDDLGNVKMGLASTIEDFLLWGMEQYPAEHYIVIFWDHGGGPNYGFGGDEVNAPPSATQINELAEVIRDVTNTTKNQFEIIGFDACLMGNAETIAGLYPYSHYVLASEDLEPGDGWQYDTFLDFINKNPKANGLDIGTEIIDGYTEQNDGESTTLSLVDSTKMPALLNSITDFANALLPYVSTTVTNWKDVATARFKAPDYSTSVWEIRSYDVVDLFELGARLMQKFPADMTLAAAVNEVKEDIDNAVVYQKNSPNRAASHGITSYFPSIMEQYVSAYPTKTVIGGVSFFPQEYLTMVQNYYDYYLANTNALVAQPNNLAFSSPNYTATASNNFEEAYATVGNDNCTSLSTDQGNAYPNAPCLSTLQFNPVVTNNLNISFDRLANQQSWPLLNGVPVLLIPDNTNPNTGVEDTFLIPVGIQGTTDGGFLIVVKEEGNYNIVGFQSTTGSINTAGKILDIKANATYIMKTLTLQNSRWLLARHNSVTLNPPFTLTFGTLPGSFDAFRFVLADLTGGLNVTAASEPY